MDTVRIDRNELRDRIAGLRKAAMDLKLDGVIILQRADLIYYTDSVFQGALAVPVNNDARLFVWRGQGLLSSECPVDPIPVRGMGKLSAALKDAGFGTWRRIGFEEDVLPVALWRRIGKGTWPEADFADISAAVRIQRRVKSESELNRIRKSGKALAAGFESLRRLIVAGVREYEVQVRMEEVMRQAGDQAVGRTRAFNAENRGVVAFGHSAAVEMSFDGPIGQPGRNPLAPMGAGSGIIGAKLPVIVDTIAGVDGYLTDMTRTFHIGEIAVRFTEAHNFCVYILEEIIQRMIPGAVPADFYLWALEEANAAGYGEYFMNRGRNKVRFLAHGIGLELDELPVLAKRFTEPLEENMVIAVEPKIIFEDGGVGVEDTVIVKPDGAEVVTPMELGLIRLPE